MEKEKLSKAELHTAGAIVPHKSKFESLKSFRNKRNVSTLFIDKWVKPYYMNLNRNDEEWISFISKTLVKIDDKIILKNLGDFNWRTRSTGAFFSSIQNKTEFIEIIGTHLLKSEVCFAGKEYAISLASFNNDLSIQYLCRYLDYYLNRPELDFDQKEIMSSLNYLDKVNNTNLLDTYFDRWEKFIFDKHELSIQMLKKISEEHNLKSIAEPSIPNAITEIETTFIQARINTINKIRGVEK